MNQINVKRLILGGIAAAAVIFALSGVINGVLLSEEFRTWSTSMGSNLTPPSKPMPLWALMCLIHGVALVWVYAGIRPRFGATPRTAMIAAVMLWLASKLATGIDLFAVGLFTPRLLIGQVLGGLITFLLGSLVGAWIYRESN